MKRIAAVLCAILILSLLQALLMPKYTQNAEGALIAEYYDNAGGNDVVFIGDCEVYESFSPITLWEEYGITSVIRGSPQQMIWQSYYLMEETFRYESPKVMVFNVLSMKYDTPESTGNSAKREAYNRMTLDGMRWSSSKWNAIRASMTEEERQWEGMVTYLFPLLRYHDRWSELTAEDFSFWLSRGQVSDNGYLMQTGVKPMTDAYAAPPIADYTLGENSWRYLDKMTALCREHDVELILIKAPTLYPLWWWEWDAQVAQYAAENDLRYINMLQYEEEIGIDWNTDTYDAGFHLNVWGAEKTSYWFGRILSEECGLPDCREDAAIRERWEEKAEVYYTRKKEKQNEEMHHDPGAFSGAESGRMRRRGAGRNA